MCAWIRACGGTAKRKYLYKEGDDNVALTGGLTTSGYSYMSGSTTVPANVVVGANNISVKATTTSTNALIGTTILLDVTDLNSISVKYENNSVENTITLPCDTLTGSYYFNFGQNRSSNNENIFFAQLSSSKTNTYTNRVARIGAGNQSANTTYVKEIALA